MRTQRVQHNLPRQKMGRNWNWNEFSLAAAALPRLSTRARTETEVGKQISAYSALLQCLADAMEQHKKFNNKDVLILHSV